MFKVVDPNSSVYVELTIDDQTRVQEFPPDDERAFVVGSADRASLRVSGKGVAPVQFHLEREDGAIWLIPAYGIDDLSVDWFRVLGPTPLDIKCVIEFCAVRIHVAITEADRLADEDDRLIVKEPDTPLSSESSGRSLPSEEDLTVLAMQPVRAGEDFDTIDSADHTRALSEVVAPLRPSIEQRWSLTDDEDTPSNLRHKNIAQGTGTAPSQGEQCSRARSRSKTTRPLLIGGACIGALVMVVALCVAGRLSQRHQPADTAGTRAAHDGRSP